MTTHLNSPCVWSLNIRNPQACHLLRPHLALVFNSGHLTFGYCCSSSLSTQQALSPYKVFFPANLMTTTLRLEQEDSLPHFLFQLSYPSSLHSAYPVKSLCPELWGFAISPKFTLLLALLRPFGFSFVDSRSFLILQYPCTCCLIRFKLHHGDLFTDH